MLLSNKDILSIIFSKLDWVDIIKLQHTCNYFDNYFGDRHYNMYCYYLKDDIDKMSDSELIDKFLDSHIISDDYDPIYVELVLKYAKLNYRHLLIDIITKNESRVPQEIALCEITIKTCLKNLDLETSNAIFEYYIVKRLHSPINQDQYDAPWFEMLCKFLADWSTYDWINILSIIKRPELLEIAFNSMTYLDKDIIERVRQIYLAITKKPSKAILDIYDYYI